MYSSLPEFTLSVVIDLIKLITVMCGILNYQIKKNIKAYVIFPSVGLVLIGGLYFFKFLNPVSIPLVTISMALVIISGRRKLICIILSFISICCLDEAINYLVCKVTRCEYGDYYILSNSLGIVIISFMAYIIKSRQKNTINKSLNHINAAYLVMLILSQTVVLFYTSSLYDLKLFSGSNIMIFVVIGIVVIVEISMLYNIIQKNYYYNISQINQKMIESQERYYMNLLDHENEIRKFRHDVNNHMICIEALLKEKKYEEVTEYFNKLRDSFVSIKSEIKTGNTIVNAIANDLNAKYPSAQLIWKGMIPQTLNISNVDICTLFSNLLQNAFENAVLSEHEKKVTVTIETVTNNIIVTVRNNIGTPVKTKGGLFETFKEDKLNHGIGTQNILKCVEENKGIIEYKYDDNFFEAKIILSEAMQLF